MKKCLIIMILFTLSIFGNLISNGDFEDSSLGWFPLTAPDSLASGFIQEICLDCGNDLSTGVHLFNAGGSPNWIGFGCEIPDFSTDEIYKLSYDVKYNCIGRPYATLIFYNEAMEIINNSAGIALSGESDWKRVEQYLTIPDSVHYMLFAVGTNDSGEYWFDNCSLAIGDTSWRSLRVDCDSEIGTIRNVSGINCGPKIPHTDWDFSYEFEMLQIPIIRTHDWYGPGDRHVIFPDWDADPYDPESYDFASTDTFIQSIIDIDAEVFFRLGESWPVGDSFNMPPPDNDVWAIVCKHIVMHYNDGWADGFHYDIDYWEIWNEPDIDIFWTGTYERYYEMYIAVAETLAAYDASLNIGGPCIADVGNRAFIDGFLNTVDSTAARLDFFSWHWYEPQTPINMINANRYLRDILDNRGFTETGLILNEWNMTTFAFDEDFIFEPIWELANTPVNAAFTAGALTLFQDEPLEQLIRYRADGPLLGIFDEYGNYQYSGFTYRMMAELYNRPNRLQVENLTASCCAESTSFSVIAGRSEDENSIAILISDWASNRNGYNLEIADLSAGSEYMYRIYALDDSTLAEIIDSAIIISDGMLSLNIEMHSPAVHLIVLDMTEASIVETNTDNTNNFGFWPNPFNDIIYIDHDDGQSIVICDISGKVIAATSRLSPYRSLWKPDANTPGGVYLIKRTDTANQAVSSRPVLFMK